LGVSCLADILVIEDSPEIRVIMRSVLEKAGHEVREAIDGVEGIAKFREKRPDLVMTDLFMPRKAGIETISDLLEIDPGAKIVAMTAHGNHENYDFLRVAEALGAVATVEKPFIAKELVALVARMLAIK
jgi:two-component system, chemotaxis family, chemotaxis protein CheY